MDNLQKAKEIIKKYYNVADCGIFNTRNLVGDYMVNIYDSDDLTIDICYNWAYFEVFDLSEEQFNELRNFYYSLGNLKKGVQL
jgi:hypothetical protein